jgi:hypothetical protein
LGGGGITFSSNKAMKDYGPTRLNMTGCIFAHPGPLNLIVNRIPDKVIVLKTTGSVELSDRFAAAVVAGGGKISVDSDLPGLEKH